MLKACTDHCDGLVSQEMCKVPILKACTDHCVRVRWVGLTGHMWGVHAKNVY